MLQLVFFLGVSYLYLFRSLIVNTPFTLFIAYINKGKSAGEWMITNFVWGLYSTSSYLGR